MAMINCPECGKEISDKAKACIHCGCPINDVNEVAQILEKNNKNKNLRNSIIFSVLGVVANAFGVFCCMTIENMISYPDDAYSLLFTAAFPLVALIASVITGFTKNKVSGIISLVLSVIACCDSLIFCLVHEFPLAILIFIIPCVFFIVSGLLSIKYTKKLH